MVRPARRREDHGSAVPGTIAGSSRVQIPEPQDIGIVDGLGWNGEVVEVDTPVLQDVHGPLHDAVSTDNREEPKEPADTSRRKTPASSPPRSAS